MAAVHSRYARAFADVVLDRKLDPAQLLAELKSMVDACSASPELFGVWENPAIPADQKRSLLDALASRLGASRPVRNLVAVLIDRRRIAALPQIAQQVERELNERLGIAEAEITTVRELSEPEKKELEAQVAQVTGRKIRARYQRDPELIGGAVVRVGSTIYDGSVRGQLARLKEQLASG